MRLGFAGLGLMGEPMAAALLSAGIPLVAYNRSRPPRQRLEAAGAHVVSTVDELFVSSDTILLMLADDTAVAAVLGRGTAAFNERVRGKLIVNMGTHAPDWSMRLAGDVTHAGGRFMEAPVSGSSSAAKTASLVAMIAGNPDDLDKIKPVLQAMCRTVVVAGAVPSALAAKLTVNLYLIASVAALSEAAKMAEKLNVDPKVFQTIIAEGPLGSDVARGKLTKMIERDFAPQASIADVCKNAALVAEAAARVGTATDMLTPARHLFEQVRHEGGSALDMAAIITAGTGDQAHG